MRARRDRAYERTARGVNRGDAPRNYTAANLSLRALDVPVQGEISCLRIARIQVRGGIRNFDVVGLAFYRVEASVLTPF